MLVRMNSKIHLMFVEFIPKSLETGTLYVSERFKVAAHMCPCGCGNKIVTPLGPAEWSFSEKNGKPTLSPSIGNWQIPCRSHYWIRAGEIEWSYEWSEEKIEAGRKRDRARLEAYIKQKEHAKKQPIWRRFVNWLFGNG